MRTGTLFGLALAAGSITMSARADEATTLSKLDAIERRLAQIEAMEQARGPRLPFAFTIPISVIGGQGAGYYNQACLSLGYGHVVTIAAPPAFQGAPSAMTVICYEPRNP